MVVQKFEVYWINLDPTLGREIQKTRPGIVISPNEMNENMDTVIIAPMTSKIRSFPFRVSLTFLGTRGQIALDQMRCVDKIRLGKKMGRIDSKSEVKVLDILQEMFA